MRENIKRPRKPNLKHITWIDAPVVIAGVERRYYAAEIAFQTYCVQWIRKHKPWLKVHHSANEREGAKFGLRVKLMGQSKGFPDLLIFDAVSGLKRAIEFKVHNGKLSPQQSAWLETLSRCGFKTAVVYTFEEFLATIDDY